MTMLVVALLCLCAGAALAKPFYALHEAEKHFEEFIIKYDRHYANEAERRMRLEVFKQNLKKINERNMDPSEDAEFGINHFADMTKEEMSPYIGSEKKCTLLEDDDNRASSEVHHCQIKKNMDRHVNNILLPDSLDWRKNNIVTEVKSQKCGDCWAFGTTGNVESMYAKKYGKLLNFSEQQLLDCDKNNRGCNGGTFNYSLGGLVTIGGMMKLEDYPYEGIVNDICLFNKTKAVAKLKDCIIYDLKDEEQLRAYLATNGPIAISVAAHTLQSYKKGILRKCLQKPVNHATLLVGYGTEKGTPFWIIKNSWSTHWGEDGYFRMKRNENLCGIVNPCAGTAVIA